MINFYNIDCMKYMQSIPNKHYNLAIVDPPYGISFSKKGFTKTVSKKNIDKYKKMFSKEWDKYPPDKEYFEELFRISKNQIIWGANYFCNNLPITKSWLYWDKMNDGFCDSYSTGELAWTSFNNNNMKQVRYKYQGNYEGFENRITTRSSKPYLLKIHPTQKPVNLYRWLLQKYAKKGDVIFDSHGGSMTIAIACDIEQFDLDICEIDSEYYNSGKMAFDKYKQQLKIF